MSNDVIDWAVGKLEKDNKLKILDRTPESFLNVQYKDDYPFLLAILGVQGFIKRHDVEPLFIGDAKPQLVVNIPSKTLWSGSAIDYIHSASAAFGSLGDAYRASSNGNAGSYRNKNMAFFIKGMNQHTNVTNVAYVYENVFYVDRVRGKSLTVAVVDAYNMSAEDVRNAKAQFGHLDIIVKSTSYGSITDQAKTAAESMNVQVLKFGELMGRLNS